MHQVTHTLHITKNTCTRISVSDFPHLLNDNKNNLQCTNNTKYFNKNRLPLINNTKFFEKTLVNYALNDIQII
jgi:hypothetical protein